MKKIIHPTDFSENATKAFEFAVGIAKKFDAELVLLNIGDLPTAMSSSSLSSSFPDMEEEKKAFIIERLKSYAANYIKDTTEDFNIQFKVKWSSSTASAIVETVNEVGADLVVIGTKGQSELKQIIMGSTTKALVSKAPCPVLSIPEKAIYSGIRQIVYASDIEPNDIAVINKIAELAQSYNADISALHVYKKEPKADSEVEVAFKKQLSEEVNYSNFSYDTLVSNNVPETLVRYVKDSNADLLVLLEKENTGFRGLFHKGIVKQFVDHAATIPLMSYNIHSIRTPEAN